MRDNTLFFTNRIYHSDSPCQQEAIQALHHIASMIPILPCTVMPCCHCAELAAQCLPRQYLHLQRLKTRRKYSKNIAVRFYGSIGCAAAMRCATAAYGIRHTECAITRLQKTYYIAIKSSFLSLFWCFFGGQLHIYYTPKQYILHTNIIYITPSNHIYRHTAYAKRPFYDAFQLQNEILDCNDFLPSARYLHTKKAFCIHLYGICRRPAICISSCSCYSS